MTDENTEIERWKRKYYDGLDELERKERRWETVENGLRQAISRITLLAEVQDEALSSQLDRLRRDLRARKDFESLLGPLDSVSKALLQEEEARQRGPSVPTPAETLHRLLDSLEIPRGLRRKARAVEKQLLAKTKTDDLDESLKAVSELIAQIQQWVGEEAAGKPEAGGESLLGRLFSSKATPEPTSEPTPVVSPEPPTGYAADKFKYLLGALDSSAPFKDTLEALKTKADAVSDDKQLHVLIDAIARFFQTQASQSQADPGDPATAQAQADTEQERVSAPQILVELLQRLDFPSEFSAQADVLKERLRGATSDAQILTGMRDSADLITGVRLGIQNEKQDIEAFLQQLTDRLQALDQNLAQSADSREAAVAQRESMDLNLGEQVQGMRDSVHEASDLATLKSTIQERLDHIQAQMTTRREMEHTRSAQVQVEIAQMSERMRSLENETHTLRTRLSEQRKMAQTDALTGLPNRLAYDMRVAQEMARWQRYKRPIVIAIADIDLFKRINDNLGHKAGDKLLRIVAQILIKNTRETDFIARYGGEEFVLLMPETDPDTALIALEKLRLAVQDCGVHFNDKPVPVTISIGFSALIDEDTASSAFERADKALYRAKGQGRNQCQASMPG